MSSSTLFQSMLLSKPRVENFHGSRIKSPGFILSSRFSCVKFNASALSNLKVKSFMCCSAKVQNFVKSTTCSSTSKISNSGEADENYFEKVLIDRILKAVKWLKIPAVLVLFLTMTMSGRRGYSALAASSGSISSSSYESSALNQQHESLTTEMVENSCGVGSAADDDKLTTMSDQSSWARGDPALANGYFQWCNL
ncbi:hypothetical protein LWI29_036254 [Acer saccharum]|uniref:Uncharacterized protein n=1 Tax=Acer saccharum TaxID=4024 RepID=A0AA39S399_ACESA|nr:hypothetical protein LWI29_036254 [Acer saccharum]